MNTPYGISPGEGKSKKLLINLPFESAQKAEWLAGELKVSQAEAIRRAVSAYAEQLKNENEQEELHHRRLKAYAELKEIRKMIKPDPGFNAARVIRQYRDHDRLAQLRGRREKGKQE